MLNFFRKLRKKEMKGTRYLKYAIGEIILVVIGILIALSINNWNENRKNQLKESLLLNNITEDLEIDANQITKSLNELNDQLNKTWTDVLVYMRIDKLQ